MPAPEPRPSKAWKLWASREALRRPPPPWREMGEGSRPPTIAHKEPPARPASRLSPNHSAQLQRDERTADSVHQAWAWGVTQQSPTRTGTEVNQPCKRECAAPTDAQRQAAAGTQAEAGGDGARYPGGDLTEKGWSHRGQAWDTLLGRESTTSRPQGKRQSAVHVSPRETQAVRTPTRGPLLKSVCTILLRVCYQQFTKDVLLCQTHTVLQARDKHPPCSLVTLLHCEHLLLHQKLSPEQFCRGKKRNT